MPMLLTALTQIFFGAYVATAQTGLEAELARLGVRSALIISSQAVDGSPVWSPAGDAIAANIEGKWSSVDLRNVKLIKGSWHGNEPIGVVDRPGTTQVPEAEVKTWEKAKIGGQRKVVAKDGTKVELLFVELGTRLVITRKTASPEIVWTTDMENCHGLALSPSGKQVAYVCELNGVIVTDLGN